MTHTEYMRVWRSTHKESIARTNKKWSEAHKDRKNGYRKTEYDGRQAWLNERKSKPCMDCGHQYPPYVMQFDHRDPATKRDQVRSSHMIPWMIEEIKRCDLVCANCHAERTHKQREAGLF